MYFESLLHFFIYQRRLCQTFQLASKPTYILNPFWVLNCRGWNWIAMTAGPLIPWLTFWRWQGDPPREFSSCPPPKMIGMYAKNWVSFYHTIKDLWYKTAFLEIHCWLNRNIEITLNLNHFNRRKITLILPLPTLIYYNTKHHY